MARALFLERNPNRRSRQIAIPGRSLATIVSPPEDVHDLVGIEIHAGLGELRDDRGDVRLLHESVAHGDAIDVVGNPAHVEAVRLRHLRRRFGGDVHEDRALRPRVQVVDQAPERRRHAIEVA